jgi:PAS domain S-box-containing protein
MMADFLKSQLDYIFFFYGLAFLLLIPVCVFLRRRSYGHLAWFWLGWFAATHSANEWLDLLALNFGSGTVFDLARLALLIISFASLAEFGRHSIVTIRGHGPGHWVLALMVGLAALGGLAGLAGLNAATRYILGLVGGLGAAWALFLASKTSIPGARQLQTAALGMVGFALATGLVPNSAPFFPASVLNYESFLSVTGIPIQLIRGFLVLWVCTSLSFFVLACLDAEKDYPLRNWFRNLIKGAMAGVTLMVISGWFITQHLGDIAASIQPIAQGRLLGISFTLLLSLLLTGFLVIIAMMRENEEGFRQLFDSAADILILHDKGRIIKVNQQACHSLGYTSEEIAGMTVFEFEVGYRKDFLIDLWEKGGDVGILSGIYQRKDGSTFPVEIQAGQVIYRGQKLRLAAVRDITARKRSEEALRQSQERYRVLAGHLMTAQEAERKRLARELHDDLSQRLAALAMEAETLERQTSRLSAADHARLKEMKDKLVELSIDVHAMSRRLHPSILDDLGLADAVASECAMFRKRDRIVLNYRVENISREVPPNIAVCLYRIVQEALRNISRHSGATEVAISLVGENQAIRLSIRDNGKGFDPDQKTGKVGLGLDSMKERAYLIGGDFSAKSQPGQGTVIEVLAPLSRRVA